MPDICLLNDLTEDSTLVDGFLTQNHCLPYELTNEVAREQMPKYVQKVTAEIDRVAASAISGSQLNAIIRRKVVESINFVTRLMTLTIVG